MRNYKANYIKGRLKMRGESVTSLARKLNRPFGTVINVINGYRTTSPVALKVRQEIAVFLKEPMEALFQDEVHV